jgi:FtsP/CotA-like multicopper oxidase with cupredoxin domain
MVQQVVSRLDLPNTTPTSLMSVQIAGDTPSNPRQTQFIAKAPTPPTFLADITDKEIKSTKIITFNSKASLAEAQHTVDGKQFDGKIGKVVLVNEAEEWTIVNTTVADGKLGPATPIDHPFHIHLNPFQITEVFDPNAPLTDEKTGRPVMESDSGKPYPKYVFQDAAKKRERQCVINPQDKSTWKPCSGGSQRKNIWWDVFPIPAAKIATDSNNNPIIGTDGQPVIIGGYFKMRSRFVDYPGFYVLHCHILAHEDRGMMTVVYVQPLSAPFQHH